MASRYWGINRGQTEFSVVEGAATNSTDAELVLDLTKHFTKEDLLLALDYIRNAIIKDIWPPA